ncbi:glycosyltransferase family 4 protein [Ekhidna sp.]|uniref:glycosyltransferase family 4 protein n=1 Tax=Ekhidna sp. TaxID=2608089 RepID=UPI003B5143A6
MKKIKIAFFIDTLKEGLDGVSNTSHQIIERLGEHAIEPLFITGLPPENPKFPYRVYQTRYIPLPYWKDLRLAIPSRKRIFKVLDEFKPDLIHWSTPSLLGKIAVSYSIKRSIPNIAIYHTHIVSHADYFRWLPFKSFLTKRANKILRKFYNKTSSVLAPTSEMKNYLISIGLPEDKIKIWGRGVNCRLFNPTKRNESYFNDLNRNKKLLFVSRLVNYKETDTLIKLSHVLPNNLDLFVIGEGPEKKKMIEESNPANTRFLGWLQGEELAEAIASCDLFVFPSISETFGNVVLEAMASGLPVIAAEGGGPKSIVQVGKTGYLVKPKSIDAMLEKIEFLTSNEELLFKMSKQARQYAESQSWSKMVSDLIEIYRNAIR